MSMGIILALPSIFGLYIVNIEEKPDNKTYNENRRN